MKRIEDVPMLPREEIARRLSRIRKESRGIHPKPGPGISLKCIQYATGLGWSTVYGASHGEDGNGNPLTRRTQMALSVFFARYDAGEISFIYHSQRRVIRDPGTPPGKWEVVYNEQPVSREAPMPGVTMTDDGPKLGFRMMNRTWV